MDNSFIDIHNRLPRRLDNLVNAKKYPIRSLSEEEIKKIFGENNIPIEGVFLISNHHENNPVYVRRSRNYHNVKV